MSHAIKNVTIIRNKITGETGIFKSRWMNPFSEQEVVNVRVGNLTVSWNILSAEVA